MSTLRIAPVVLTLLVTISPSVLATEAASISPPTGAGDDSMFRYPLRPNENLHDVARIFRMPVDALIEANRIADPSRLRAGLLLEVPNAFATEAHALRQERDRLATEKRAAEAEASAKQQALAGAAAEIGKLEAERDRLGNALGATAHWERGAKGLALGLLALAVWIIKLAADRNALTRRLNNLAAENSALAIAKQSYKDAVAQLELRFQQLYSGKKESPRELVTDGVRRIKAVFADGTRQIERQIQAARIEREKDEQLLDATHRTFGWLAHPIREMVARYRLKEHASS